MKEEEYRKNTPRWPSARNQMRYPNLQQRLREKPVLIPGCIGAILMFLSGCGEQQPDFKPISGGFGVVTKWVGVDSGPGYGLFYKGDQAKPTLIWPFLGLSEDDPLFTNDLAFFVAEMPDAEGKFGDSIYVAVQAPGPALDVSEDILKLWAESKKLDFAKVRRKYSPLRLEAVPGGIQVQYLGDENLPAIYAMSWEQVSNLIQEVKRTAKQRTIEKPHTIYLKNDYGPENSTN